ncbi:MAG: hypothetical protein WC325_12550 [Candidatus Bathyarchaeia archaeon]
MICADCHQDIMQRNPEMCPYCHSKNLISEEKFAELEKAKPIAKKEMGKIDSVVMECPYCGSSQKLASKSNEVTCAHCHKIYTIPKKVLDLL